MYKIVEGETLNLIRSDMLIRRYTYVDVYYNENEAEIKKALRERERLIMSGYELMAGDTAEKKPIP